MGDAGNKVLGRRVEDEIVVVVSPGDRFECRKG
jgi:hypothetical protein